MVNKEGRDAADTKRGGCGRVAVRVHFSNQQFSFICDRFEHRRDGLAWAAPGGPEINYDPFVAADCGLVFRVGDVLYFAHGFTQPSVTGWCYDGLR